MNELRKLLDAGYEVQLTQNPEGDDYLADVIHHTIGFNRTAAAATPGEALWAASPLHDEGEEYSGDYELPAVVIGSAWQDGFNHGRESAATLDVLGKWCTEGDTHEKCHMGGICDCECHRKE